VLRTTDGDIVVVLLVNEVVVHRELFLPANDSFSSSLCTFLFHSFSSYVSLFLASPSFFLSLVLSKCCCVSVFKTIFPLCFTLFPNFSVFVCH
jgi:hypothetical protein